MSDINPAPDEAFNDVFGGRQPVAGFVADAITSVAPHSSLRHVAAVLRDSDVSLAIVADDEKLYGVVSERDIVNAVALGSDLDTTEVEAIETENLKWAAATSTVDDVEISAKVHKLEVEIEQIELGDYEHYMLKEIFEQPKAISETLLGRFSEDLSTYQKAIRNGDLEFLQNKFNQSKKIRKEIEDIGQAGSFDPTEKKN